MFGFVKNWFRKSADVESADGAVAGLLNGDGESTQNQNEMALAEAGEAEVAPPNGNGSVDYLDLPLISIINLLPADLKSRVRLPADDRASVSVPLAVIYPQLGRGSVKVTFGELRQMAAEEVFYSQSDRDQAIVELPLAEILRGLNPISLPRRTQKQVSIPEEIVSPFDAKGEGLHIYKPESSPGTAFVRKIQEPAAVTDFPARGSLSSIPPIFQRTNTPLSPNVASPWKAVPPITSALVQAPVLPTNGNGNSLPLPLIELAAGWPEAIRKEIAQMNLTNATMALPMSFAEECLRKGKAISAWKQIRSWTDSPATAMTESAHDAELLELPLSVIAPLFLGKLQARHAPQKVQVDTNIPDLFSNNGKVSAPVESPSPVIPAQATAAPVPANSKVEPGEAGARPLFNFAEGRGKARQANTEQFIRSGTDFLRRYATPNDIVAKAGGAEGVEGALITLPDGLLVASHLPGGVIGDTLAAFVPQLFGRVSQSSREFRMGELTDLSFTVGNTPWVIFKVGAIFFAAFGRAGEALPLEQLKTFAGELDRKKQTQ